MQHFPSLSCSVPAYLLEGGQLLLNIFVTSLLTLLKLALQVIQQVLQT
jgi:hypothetical protein